MNTELKMSKINMRLTGLIEVGSPQYFAMRVALSSPHTGQPHDVDSRASFRRS